MGKPFNPESWNYFFILLTRKLQCERYDLANFASFSMVPEKSVVIPVNADGQVKAKLIKNPEKYKTEICKSFEKGECIFGFGCQFAHGLGELRPVKLHNKYKTIKCRNYATTGQ